MLSPADAALVKRDPELPGLATCLDSELLAQAIKPFLNGHRLAPNQISYIRYKPRRSCLVSHQMDCDGQPVTLSATALSPSAIEQLAKARQWAGDHGVNGPWPIVLPELALMVFSYPFDMGLNGLLLLDHPDTRLRFLEKLLPDRNDLWHGEMTLIRYKPQRRCVARLDVDHQPRAVIKLYTRSGFPAAQLNAKAFRSRSHVRIPERMGRSNRHYALAMEWLPGQLLVDELSKPHLQPDNVKSVGMALGELHGQRARKLSARTRADEIDALEPIVQWLNHVCPELEKTTGKLYSRLAKQIQCLPLADAAVHGDFYSKQVLLHQGTVAIIDFDEAFRGHAAYDLGMFAAHLISDSMSGLAPASVVEPACNALLEGYQAIRGQVDVGAVALYTAVGLLRLAPHPFRNRVTKWRESTACMLALAEQYCQTSSRESRRWAVCS